VAAAPDAAHILAARAVTGGAGACPCWSCCGWDLGLELGGSAGRDFFGGFLPGLATNN